MTLYLGLHGFARSGKDTVCWIVAELLGDDRCTRIALADPIREALYALNPTVVIVEPSVFARRPPETVNRLVPLATLVDEIGWEEAKAHEGVRVLLQRMGTDVGRTQWSEHFWTDLTLAEATRRDQDLTIITDVRFKSEAAAVRVRGGRLWKIKRPGVGPVNDHVSDAGLPDEMFHRIIVNDGSIGDLRLQLEPLVTDLRVWLSGRHHP